MSTARRGLEIHGFEAAGGWLELARCYSSAGRHQNAWQAFREASRLDRDSFDAALGAAVESIACGNESRALSELKEADARLGASALLEFNRGVAHYKLGQEGAAREAWMRARDLDSNLGAADLLVTSLAVEVGSGSWVDHWFGAGVGSWRKMAGGVLVAFLLLFLAAPYLEPDLVPGVQTGQLTFQAFVPAVLIGLLVVFPSIRGLAVGGVSLDVTPLQAPRQGPQVDPLQVLPALSPDEIDVSRLISR